MIRRMKKTTGWVSVSVALVAAVIAIGYARSHRHDISPEQFAAMSQQDRNLAVYDALVRNLHEYYFDRKALDSKDWQTILADFRAKAAAAPSSGALYDDVLFQLAEKFPHSHVFARRPDLPVPPVIPKSPTANQPPPPRDTEPNHGFDMARVRRNGGGMGWVVGDVLPGSAAERAGIAPGWAIADFSMHTSRTSCRFKGDFIPLSPELALQRERGEDVTLPTSSSAPDQKAAFEALKQNLEFDCELLPPIPAFETRQLAGGVTYVRFNTFMDTAVVDQALAAIDAAGPAGVIVDLRHNNGGKQDEMQRVLGRLIGPDAYIGTFRNGIGSWRIQNYRTLKDARGYAGPVAVLIGPLSASAAEITASAVLDNKRGHVVGRWSAGSVLSSQTYPLPDGGSCQIPIQDFVRGGGGDRRIEGLGVAPDVVVMPTLADVRSGRDLTIDRALEGLKN
jgi:carboxyl-terminal processing protease